MVQVSDLELFTATAAVPYAVSPFCAPQRLEPPEAYCNADSGKCLTALINGTSGNKFAGAKPFGALATYLPRPVYRIFWRISLGDNRLDSSDAACHAEPMTVCIAAVCQHKGQGAVVLCCDWQGTQGQLIKAENTDKILSFGPMSAMIAGHDEDAKELAIKCSRALKHFSSTTESAGDDYDLVTDQFLSAIRKVVDDQKQEMVRRFIMQRYALTPDVFWNNARGKRYEAMTDEIRDIGLGGSLILCAAPDKYDAVMLHIDGQSCRVAMKEGFAVIGSGSLMALSVLNQYQFNDDLPLMKCLRRVYAAKVAAECDLYVGRDTSLEILWKGRHFVVSDQAFTLIDKSVRSVREPVLPFKPEYLEEA